MLRPLHLLSNSPATGFFSTAAIKVPPVLVEKMEKYFSDFERDGIVVTMPPRDRDLLMLGKELQKEFRENREVAEFLQTMQRLRDDKMLTALFLTGMPSGEVASTFLIHSLLMMEKKKMIWCGELISRNFQNVFGKTIVDH